MPHPLQPMRRPLSPTSTADVRARVRWTSAAAFAAILILAGCGATPVSAPAPDGDADSPAAASDSAPSAADEEPAEAEPAAEPAPEQAQQETCDWDAPKLTGPAAAPTGQDGDLAEILPGSWQHTHTDESSGFEEVMNDHRYVFPSTDRMLYCQHVPGATEYAENAGDVVLNGTAIELPGGTYSYTLTAWDADTLVWDNPVGGGYVYLLQRR